jgi:hypothetical protein
MKRLFARSSGVLRRPNVQAAMALQALLLVMSLSPQPVKAQRNAWAQPLILATQKSSSWFPALAADATGRVHLAFASSNASPANVAEGIRPYDMVFYAPIRDGEVEQTPVDVMSTEVTNYESYAARPNLAVDQRGILHMTWRDKQGIYYTQAPVDRAHDPAAWRSSEFINGGYFSLILADKRGRLHLLLTENVISTECTICFHLYHYYSDDNGNFWSQQRDISVLPTGAAKPVAVLDGDDNVHVVWEMARGGDLGQTSGPKRVAYIASYDRGETWTDPVTFVPGGSGTEAGNPSIAIDGKGNLVWTWSSFSDTSFYSQISQDLGRSWSAPQPIPGAFNTVQVYDNRLDSQAMATDSAGRVHLIAIGRTALEQRALSVLHFVWDGASWSAPEVVTTVDPGPGGNAPQWPAVTVAMGNQLHVSWYLRYQAMGLSSDSESPPYAIAYTNVTLDAPAIPPQAYPTPTPIPTATPLPVAAVAAAATIVVENTEPGQVSVEALKNEYAVWQMLALALLPLLAISAVILAVRRVRR